MSVLVRAARAVEVLAPLALIWYGVSLYDVRAAPVVIGVILWLRHLMDVRKKNGILD